MDRVVVEHYLARAESAASVRELHAIVRAVRLAHAGDPDAERVEQACWTAALRVVAAPPERSPPAVMPPAYLARTAVVGSRVPLVRAAAAPRVDWKERAAST